MDYNKIPLPPAELVELCKKRGLIFGDEAAAREFLGKVTFYRLKGYLLHFERKIPDNSTHQVPAGTTFEKVIELYELDRRLRLLFFEALERIEISFRSAISNAYSLSYGPHWWEDPMNFSNQAQHARMVARIKRDLAVEEERADEPRREREVYIDHYFSKYTNPAMPPSWMLAECLSLGVWSTLFGNLASRHGQLAVAKLFNVPHLVLASWIHALTVTRNICAHHGRLWNRVFVFKPTALTGYEGHFQHAARIYPQAFAVAYLLRRIHPSSDWHLRMKEAFLSCPAEEMAHLGTPHVAWHKNLFWTEAELPLPTPKTIQPVVGR